MAKGLTDAQLDAMDEMEARQNLYGTAARVLESPDAAPMTDAQMNQRATSDSVMQATPFGQATMPQSAPQPPQADFREPPKPLTDAELNAQEDNLYYDPSYEMPFEEFAPVHARRQQEKNTVGSFVDGAVAAGQGLVSLTAEMGGELRDNFTSNLFRPDRFATQNFVTLKEAGRKTGLEFAKLVDWIGNTARDHATDVRRQEQVRSVIAQKLQAEGKLSGDLRGDIEIINREFAAAKERGETAPTPLEENADVEQAFEDYRRGKNFDREIAGVGNFSIGQTPVTQESSEARATNPFTGKVMEPQRALATGGAMAFAPDNLLPVGAGVMSKVRILRRLSSITGVPLKMTENVANAGADALQRGAMRITDKVQDLTGMNAMQQTAAATALTGGVGYLSTQGQGAPAALGGVATGVLSILPIMKFGGAILRRTGATAGGGYAIVREMGAGGAGAAGAETAQAMAGSGVFPQRYARHMRPGGASADSTLRRVAQDPENPQMLRRLSRTANNLGATQAFRLTDDVVSSAAVSGLAAAPFALVAPDAEQGGQIVGGALMLGTLAGTATRTFGRRPAEVDADIARMLVDVTESNGDAASLMSLSHDSLSQLAAMQGVLRNKVKFIPLRGQDYRANTDLRAEGGETAAGLYIEKDANGSARIFVNMGHTAPMDGKVSVRPDADKGGNVIDITAADGTVDSTHVPQGIRLLVKTGDAVSANQRLAQDLSPTRIVPHEIGHAILTSDILDGQPRNDLRNLVNQQYATDGVAARGREYATRLVDKDILVGAIEDAPVNLTDAQINDISSGKTTLADVLKGQPVSEQARQRLIDQRVEELSQRSIEKGQDPLDWARDEIIAETFASEAPAIDFRAIRRDALFPRLAESMLSAGGRVLEVMGARLDPGTGKLMDNPSVLFRDNPLFQDRIMQKRVREYVRSYDQYLAGLEEAGAKELRGVELARSSKPEDLARSTHVKLRDEGNGVLENDFMVQRPDGTYTMKAQKTVNLTENARSAQIKTLYDARKFVPVNSQEFGKRKVNGREVVGGPVLPKQFDFFTNFPKYLRPDPTTGDIGLVRKIEASREDGGSWDIDVNVIGTGSSGRYRVINLGNTRAVQRETVPYGWIISKANHLLAASLDLNSFRGSAMKAINKGDLGLFNNDMRQVEADLKTYLANHRNGRPGEMTIGQQKRDMLNGLIGTGTAVQRTANPLYSDLNPRGSIRTWRVDRLNDAKPTGRTGYFFDYDKINNNRMPSALPQAGMAMPDTPANLSTDQILRELEENQGYLGLSTLGMREGRPVKGGAQQTRELLKRNTALNEELKRRGGPQEESDVERVLRQRGQAMPDISDAPPFYLKSSQALDTKIQGKAATPDQVKAILTNPQNGIKAEELKWTGVMQEVERLAKENNGKVPKEALLRYLAEDGAVRLEEVRMRDVSEIDVPARWEQQRQEEILRARAEEYARQQDRSADDVYDEIIRDAAELSETMNEARIEWLDSVKEPPTKFGQYQLPGGENYREVNLVMPGAADWKDFPSAHQYSGGPEDLKRIAHMRLNDRIDAKGKPGLFIEELQSDRHQAGREKGYDAGERNKKLFDAAREFYYKIWIPHQQGKLPSAQANKAFDELSARTGFSKAEIQDEGAARKDFTSQYIEPGIPDAPFRTSWPLQLFKRALRDAVADGKEWIGWTTGETQAARYDLSQQIDQLQYSKELGRLWATKDGAQVINEKVPEGKLADYVGKEPAKKLLESKAKTYKDGSGNTYHEISGLELKVGGEGMKGFYDTMVPKDVAKYVKQWGAQVEKVDIKAPETAGQNARLRYEVYDPSGQVYDAFPTLQAARAAARDAGAGYTVKSPERTKPVAVWRVNITPQMREGIKKAGQALFVGGVAAVVAEDQLE
jgi:hypothetical protein